MFRGPESRNCKAVVMFLYGYTLNFKLNASKIMMANVRVPPSLWRLPFNFLSGEMKLNRNPVVCEDSCFGFKYVH